MTDASSIEQPTEYVEEQLTLSMRLRLEVTQDPTGARAVGENYLRILAPDRPVTSHFWRLLAIARYLCDDDSGAAEAANEAEARSDFRSWNTDGLQALVLDYACNDRCEEARRLLPLVTRAFADQPAADVYVLFIKASIEHAAGDFRQSLDLLREVEAGWWKTDGPVDEVALLDCRLNTLRAAIALRRRGVLAVTRERIRGSGVHLEPNHRLLVLGSYFGRGGVWLADWLSQIFNR